MSEASPLPHIKGEPLYPEVSRETKLASVRELMTSTLDGEPDVVFSLGASLKHNPATGKYRTLAFSDFSEHGLVTGSRTRVIATADISEAFPNLPIVATSFNRLNSEEPTMASVIKGELARKGVNPSRIMLEEASFNTVTQLTELVKMANLQGWSRVAAITNRFHLPRMSEMYARLDDLIDDEPFQQSLREFEDHGGKVGFVCAEDVMSLTGNHFDSYWSAVVATSAYEASVAAEAQGLEDLIAGNYRLKLDPEQTRSGIESH